MGIGRPSDDADGAARHPSDITRFADAPPPAGESPWVDGVEPYEGDVEIVAYDPTWPDRYRDLADRIRGALGDRVLALEHVGSTSVSDLPAKPIIDVDLTVADGTDESAYVPALERAGFRLRVRESWWYGHRMLHADTPSCNLHVWSPGVAETARHVLFRDWLRDHPEDRDLYRDAKLAAASASNAVGETVMRYNARKQAVIREIYDRAFRAAGLVD